MGTLVTRPQDVCVDNVHCMGPNAQPLARTTSNVVTWADPDSVPRTVDNTNNSG